MQDSFLWEDRLTVKFPNTAILYLRHNNNTPDYMTIEIQVPGASCSYVVPTMKVQNYSIETIFEKRLFFLIPFHIFVYEKNFKKYDTDVMRMAELTKVYQKIWKRKKYQSDCQGIGRRGKCYSRDCKRIISMVKRCRSRNGIFFKALTLFCNVESICLME